MLSLPSACEQQWCVVKGYHSVCRSLGHTILPSPPSSALCLHPKSFTWNEQWYVMMCACTSDERMRTSFSTWSGLRMGLGLESGSGLGLRLRRAG